MQAPSPIPFRLVGRGSEHCSSSAPDNPLVFEDLELILSRGSFHGQPSSLALDVVAIACTLVASFSELHVESLVSPSLSELPAFLTKDSQLNLRGLIARDTSTALVAESRVPSQPASLHSAFSQEAPGRCDRNRCQSPEEA